ncbi:hypothetical protein [Derxia gummosa]|uniref:Uncharacterized protein n=1 Tax=Derxia gummosa DSM 723 TaxID=1121388 RepID=A0A9U5CJH3_9BURK|nr:hypothetical protein [Derxia gummosa]
MDRIKDFQHVRHVGARAVSLRDSATGRMPNAASGRCADFVKFVADANGLTAGRDVCRR